VSAIDERATLEKSHDMKTSNPLDRVVKLQPVSRECPWRWHDRMALYVFAINSEFRLRAEHLQLLYLDQTIDLDELKVGLSCVWDIWNEVDREYTCKHLNVDSLKMLATRRGIIDAIYRLYNGVDGRPDDEDWQNWLAATDNETAIIIRRGVYNHWLKVRFPEASNNKTVFRISRRYPKFKRQFIDTTRIAYRDFDDRLWTGEDFAEILQNWGKEVYDYEYYFLRNVLQRYFACPIDCQFGTCKGPCNKYCHRTGLSIWPRQRKLRSGS
jgi:hypothetical protein